MRRNAVILLALVIASWVIVYGVVKLCLSMF